jgi:type IV pilus assembly protein PilM
LIRFRLWEIGLGELAWKTLPSPAVKPAGSIRLDIGNLRRFRCGSTRASLTPKDKICACYHRGKKIRNLIMALLPSFKPRKPDQIVVVDLGSRTTKAVHFQRKGGGYRLSHYALLDAPVSESPTSPGLLAEHLKKTVQALETRHKQVVLALGVNESLLRQVELPMVPVSDLRQMLKFNAKNYLQQDLQDYIFDCQIMPSRAGSPPAEPAKTLPKAKVIVGGVKRQLLDDLQAAVRTAGLVAEEIVPGSLGPINAFELAQPGVFEKDVIALVDLGFKCSTVSILQEGELMLNRVVGIGGDRLTSGLAEAMNISYAEAEGIKVGMPQEVESALQPQIVPLGRELRASIDFFEHQQDKTVSQIFISGGSARSEFVIQALQNELMVPCKTWNPTSFLESILPTQQAGELEHLAPQLAVAVGVGAAAF